MSELTHVDTLIGPFNQHERLFEQVLYLLHAPRFDAKLSELAHLTPDNIYYVVMEIIRESKVLSALNAAGKSLISDYLKLHAIKTAPLLIEHVALESGESENDAPEHLSESSTGD